MKNLFLLSLLALTASAQIPKPPEARAALADPKHKLWSEHAPEAFQARFETTHGSFVVEAHREWAPVGVDRFYNLVRAGFFDDSRFFRVVAGKWVQFGIPGDPAIAAVWRNATIPADPPRSHNVRGTIGYAMITPDARTTQLYINTGDNLNNDKDPFAIFGTVVEGMDVVDKLYSGYGERSGSGMRAGRQQKLFEDGNVYLDQEFPNLDHLVRAVILR